MGSWIIAPQVHSGRVLFVWLCPVLSGPGASGALQVYSLGLSGGGGGGGFGRLAPYNTYPGQYFAIRVGSGGAGASLASSPDMPQQDLA